jgi:hypothetical protein
VGVLAAGEVLGYRPGGSPASLARLFRRIHRALAPRGVLFFDVATPGRGGPTGEMRTWREGDGWIVLAHSREHRRRRELVRRIVTLRRAGRALRRTEERHRLRLMDPGEIMTALRSAGFHARRIPLDAGGSRRGWAAFLAVKPVAGGAVQRVV